MQCFIHHLRSLVVEPTPLKNMIVMSSQNGHLPQVGVKIKILTWNLKPTPSSTLNNQDSKVTVRSVASQPPIEPPQNNFDCTENLHYFITLQNPHQNTYTYIENHSNTSVQVHNSAHRFQNLPSPGLLRSFFHWAFSGWVVPPPHFHQHHVSGLVFPRETGCGRHQENVGCSHLTRIFSREMDVEMRQSNI